MKSIKIRTIFILATTTNYYRLLNNRNIVYTKHDTSFFLFCFRFFSSFLPFESRKSFAWQNNEYKSFCVTNCVCSTVAKLASLNGITFTASMTERWFSRERKWDREKTGQKLHFSSTWHTRYSQYGQLMELRDYFSFCLVFLFYFLKYCCWFDFTCLLLIKLSLFGKNWNNQNATSKYINAPSIKRCATQLVTEHKKNRLC